MLAPIPTMNLVPVNSMLCGGPLLSHNVLLSLEQARVSSACLALIRKGQYLVCLALVDTIAPR